MSTKENTCVSLIVLILSVLLTVHAAKNVNERDRSPPIPQNLLLRVPEGYTNASFKSVVQVDDNHIVAILSQYSNSHDELRDVFLIPLDNVTSIRKLSTPETRASVPLLFFTYDRQYVGWIQGEKSGEGNHLYVCSRAFAIKVDGSSNVVELTQKREGDSQQACVDGCDWSNTDLLQRECFDPRGVHKVQKTSSNRRLATPSVQMLQDNSICMRLENEDSDYNGHIRRCVSFDSNARPIFVDFKASLVISSLDKGLLFQAPSKNTYLLDPLVAALFSPTGEELSQHRLLFWNATLPSGESTLDFNWDENAFGYSGDGSYVVYGAVGELKERQLFSTEWIARVALDTREEGTATWHLVALQEMPRGYGVSNGAGTFDFVGRSQVLLFEEEAFYNGTFLPRSLRMASLDNNDGSEGRICAHSTYTRRNKMSLLYSYFTVSRSEESDRILYRDATVPPQRGGVHSHIVVIEANQCGDAEMKPRVVHEGEDVIEFALSDTARYAVLADSVSTGVKYESEVHLYALDLDAADKSAVAVRICVAPKPSDFDFKVPLPMFTTLRKNVFAIDTQERAVFLLYQRKTAYVESEFWSACTMDGKHEIQVTAVGYRSEIRSEFDTVVVQSRLYETDPHTPGNYPIEPRAYGVPMAMVLSGTAVFTAQYNGTFFEAIPWVEPPSDWEIVSKLLIAFAIVGVSVCLLVVAIVAIRRNKPKDSVPLLDAVE